MSATTSHLATPDVATSAPRTPAWSIDTSHSSVGFSIRHMMITNVRGEFASFSGEVAYDPKKPEATRIDVKVDVASIHTRDAKRDEHLRSADFFDAAKYPSLTFVSRDVKKRGERLEVVGDLTIRDVTREVVLTVEELTGEHTDPWGKTRIGATAKTKIKRSDFGITWNAALETGGFLVGDEVTILLEVELVKQA